MSSKTSSAAPLYFKIQFLIISLFLFGTTIDYSQAAQQIPASLKGFRPPLCTEVKTAEQRVLDYYCPHGPIRLWVPLQKIDPVLAEYVVRLEDGKFYQHGGLDAAGIWDALEKDIKAGKFVRGGSTITQQLAKNLFLTKEKSIIRKIQEVPLVLRLEKELTKKQILELYLNTIEWGPGVYGIEAASRLYFDHDASRLTETERWMMALMIPNPKQLNLWFQPHGRRSLLKRARRFSHRLRAEKRFSEARRQQLLQEFTDFLDRWSGQRPKQTWNEQRQYPSLWEFSKRLSTLPAIRKALHNGRHLKTLEGIQWSIQSQLESFTRDQQGSQSHKSAFLYRPQDKLVILTSPNTDGSEVIRALIPWNEPQSNLDPVTAWA